MFLEIKIYLPPSKNLKIRIINKGMYLKIKVDICKAQGKK